jgi:hypothetical protein
MSAADQLGQVDGGITRGEPDIHRHAVVHVTGQHHGGGEAEPAGEEIHEIGQPMRAGVPALEVDLIGTHLASQELLAALGQFKPADRDR